MTGEMKQFAKDNYPSSKADVFAMFIERSFSLVIRNGYTAMITMQSWMFLSSFEELRKGLVCTKTFLSMAHLGPRAFDTISGEVVQSTAFVLTNNANGRQVSAFIRLVDGGNEAEKAALFLKATSNPNCGFRYHARVEDFAKIPGSPIAYWARNYPRLYADGATLASLHEPKKGILTSDNDRFLRRWFEISQSKFEVACKSCAESEGTGKKWFPMNKGGSAQRWYGNHEYVMNWESNGREMREWERHIQETRNAGGRVINEDCYFREGVTWSDIGSSQLAFRHLPQGFIFNARGPAFFAEGESRSRLLGFLNSSLAAEVVQLINPTICLNPSDVGRLPAPKTVECAGVVDSLIEVARADWDNFETSWDFRDLPLLRSGLKAATLAASWQNWKAHCDATIRRMQELETENNRLFIAAYGLQDELKPEVPEDQITLARADARKDMVAFLSYAIGCMFGRYSLDAPGLILADAGATVQDYLAKVPKPTFEPDADGILPVLDGDWFTDDILGRVREFLRVTFGEDTLAENIALIETALGKVDAKTGKVKPADLRTFLARDFYKEHVRTYKKRPIYWMFSSPEGSFQALIYLHRYTRDTVNLLLNDYVREFIGKLEEKHRQLTAVTLNESARPGDRTKAAKELGKIDKMLKEIKGWERDVLLPLAQQRIELDLDDGVKVNYLKFKGAVVNIPGLDKGEED
jgi:hypothetical protein